MAQYFGFAINLAQKIAYLFGEDDLFTDELELNEGAKVRVLAYLGVMLGASGSAMLVGKLAREVGKNMGKKITQQALTKTTWYPLLKKIGAMVGKRVVKESVGESRCQGCARCWRCHFRGDNLCDVKPMGGRLADVLVRNLNGEFDETGMELRPEFKKANTADADTEVTIHEIEIDD